jgi:hypothetical protein
MARWALSIPWRVYGAGTATANVSGPKLWRRVLSSNRGAKTPNGRRSRRLSRISRRDPEPMEMSSLRRRPSSPRQRAAKDRRAIRDAVQRVQSVQRDVPQSRAVRRRQHGQPKRGNAAHRDADAAQAVKPYPARRMSAWDSEPIHRGRLPARYRHDGEENLPASRWKPVRLDALCLPHFEALQWGSRDRFTTDTL